jgi:hypothetical protein
MDPNLPRIETVSVDGPSILRVRWRGKRILDMMNLSGWIATGGDILASLPRQESPDLADALLRASAASTALRVPPSSLPCGVLSLVRALSGHAHQLAKPRENDCADHRSRGRLRQEQRFADPEAVPVACGRSDRTGVEKFDELSD